MKKRKDIDKKYKWDLSNFFENDLKWQEAFEKFSLKIGEIAKYNGKLKTEQQIYDCLFLLETLDLMAEPLYQAAADRCGRSPPRALARRHSGRRIR